MKKNLKEKIINRKIKKPNPLLAAVLLNGAGLLAKMRKVEYRYEFDRKKYLKTQVIVLSQHCAREEFIYVFGGFKKKDLHSVVGYQNFFNKLSYPILMRMGTIAKYLYQPDAMALKHILRVIKNGESLLLFPEGIQSTSGSTHPVNPATMKLLMKCRLPVILCTSHGSYLTRPRFSPKKRWGKMTFTYKLLFTEEDYKTHTQDELYDILLDNFRYNEFEYNRQAKIAFKGKCENIEGLDNIIYKCPHCGAEFAFEIEGDSMKCGGCGYKVRMDEYYNLHSDNLPLYFDDIDKWYKWQRKEVAKEVKENGFCIESKVSVYDINLKKLKNTPDFVGEGTLSITNHFITYKGSYKGEQAELKFDIKSVPSLSFSPLDHSVDMYYGNDYYCFAPEENKLQVVKWMLATEEIHNLYDETWAKASAEVYEK